MRVAASGRLLPPGRPFLAFLVSASLFVSTTGCNVWIPAPEPTRTPPAYQQFQVWTRDSHFLLHHVRVENDSLYGIPVDQSRDCLTCFVVIPMKSVDSLQTGETQHVGTAIIGVAAGGVVTILLLAALLALGGGGVD